MLLIEVGIDTEGKFTNVNVSGSKVKSVVKAIRVLEKEFMPKSAKTKVAQIGQYFRDETSAVGK